MDSFITKIRVYLVSCSGGMWKDTGGWKYLPDSKRVGILSDINVIFSLEACEIIKHFIW